MFNSHFIIGKSHDILTCQDYAIFKKNIAALSDGCSSSPNTDLGARILCNIAVNENYLFEKYVDVSDVEINKYFKRIINKSSKILDELLIQPQSVYGRGWLEKNYINWEIPNALDATLWILKQDDKLINIFGTGDGVVFTLDINNEFNIFNIEYEYNTPWYLNYLNTSDRNNFFNKKKLPENVKNQDGILCFIEKYKIEKYKMIGICSDGLNSFRGTMNEEIHPKIILQNLLKFPNYREHFLKRRINHFRKYIMKENGWDHYDDFSMIIWVNDELAT